MLGQLTSPSGKASPRDTPWNVPDTVRRVPAEWVQSREARLHPPSAGAQLASWPSTVLTTHIEIPLEAH